MPADWAREIDIFETQIELKKQGKIDDKVFAETRLRRGTYGQRYDNGQRHDGVTTRSLQYPVRRAAQGSGDAVGRARHAAHQDPVRRPERPTQMDALGRSGRGVLRRHLPRHHPAGLPAALRPHRGHARSSCAAWPRSASPRARPAATRCATSPPARWPASAATRRSTSRPTRRRCMRFLLGHPDTQDFGRKFKIALSGCRQHACGLVNMHDLGLLAVTRDRERRRAARLRGLRRRRPRRRALPGQAVRRLRPRGGDPAAGAGDLARVRPPRREAQPRPRAHQVPGQESRDRGVQAPGAGGARQAAADPRWTLVHRRRCRPTARRR